MGFYLEKFFSHFNETCIYLLYILNRYKRFFNLPFPMIIKNTRPVDFSYSYTPRDTCIYVRIRNPDCRRPEGLLIKTCRIPRQIRHFADNKLSTFSRLNVQMCKWVSFNHLEICKTYAFCFNRML